MTPRTCTVHGGRPWGFGETCGRLIPEEAGPSWRPVPVDACRFRCDDCGESIDPSEPHECQSAEPFSPWAVYADFLKRERALRGL